MKVIYTKNLKQVTKENFVTEKGFSPIKIDEEDKEISLVLESRDKFGTGIWNIEKIPKVNNVRYLTKDVYEYFVLENTHFTMITILEETMQDNNVIISNIYLAIICKEDEEDNLLTSLINYNEESFKYLLAEHFDLYTDGLPMTIEESTWYHNNIVEVSTREDYIKMEEERKKQMKSKRVVTYRGKNYKNLKALCKDLDIPYTRVSQNLRRDSKTLEQVIEQQLAKK